MLKRQAPQADIQFIKLSEEAILPTKSHELDAGYDLHVVCDSILHPGTSKLIYTKIQVEFPKGYCGVIHGRSGLAARNSILAHSGVIDYGYQGEIGVVLFSLAKETHKILKGDRIAQLVITRILPPPTDCEPSKRGKRGFGSTGN